MIPPSLAAMWIASRWLQSRGATNELRSELAALREELAELRQAHVDSQERLDFAERLLSQIRESNRELPRAKS
jgi:predicted  nucleic acid-binding Zn-ribbon protein